MVTGDNIQTAKAIALECGILDATDDATEPTVIEGKTFRALPEKEREQVAKKVTVWFSYHRVLTIILVDLQPKLFLLIINDDYFIPCELSATACNICKCCEYY